MKPEVEQLLRNPRVIDIVGESRRLAEPQTYRLPFLPDTDFLVQREGQYPLHTHEGNFQAHLLHVSPLSSTESFRGGEFRVIGNKEVNHRLYEQREPLLIFDASPQFLREMSDSRIQHALSSARNEIQQYPGPAFLIQTRASDVHDGIHRLTHDGQLDIQEEQWWAQVLTVMKQYPGLNETEAQQMLIRMNKKRFLVDYGLGIMSTLRYFYHDRIPEKYQQMVIDSEDLLLPFSRSKFDHTSDISDVELLQKVHAVTDPHRQLIEVSGQQIVITTLASYPLMQKETEVSVRLVAAQKKGSRLFRTFRIIESGDSSDAYYRADSICSNGVSGGDNHCECRIQLETELARVQQGKPMRLIMARDDEGRNHGEGDKGATLAIQRRLFHQLGVKVGNGVAAQLFYHQTNEPVDARTYEDLQAVFKYLGYTHIPHLVTNNQEKIAAIKEVAEIEDVVSADVLSSSLSQEAKYTRQDKEEGNTGVLYQYES